MNLSQELRERIESDHELLQRSAIHLIKAVAETYSLGFDKIADEMHVLRSEVLGWLTDSPPTLLDCGVIFAFAASQYFPVEWEIRGKILDEYNDTERVPRAREFIKKINERLTLEGIDGEGNSQQLALLVARGMSTVFELGSNPGFFRIALVIRRLGEDLYIHVERIDLERDVTVSGGFEIHLPTASEALNFNTMQTYIPHSDHTFTISDWDEMNRWITEAKVVDPGFWLVCYTNSMQELFNRGSRKERVEIS